MSRAGARFSGKVAIVTGGAGGIGGAIVRCLAEDGAAVVIGDNNAPNGMAATAEIEGKGGQARFIEMDLGRPADASRLVQAAVEAFGRLDILVNCAAIPGVLKPIVELTLEDWNEVIQTNVNGTFLVTQAAVRQLLAQGEGGAVVNILAIQSFMPLPEHAAYATSKGALTTFTRALAVELAENKIRVNGIDVGSIYTAGAQEGLAQMDLGQADKSAATLVGRMGRPEEIANLAVFLASEEASYLAGAIIPADGGRLLSRKSDPFLTVRHDRPPRA
jgi:glucose 1-dehydrogenase